ncbi:PAS domain-containing protein [Massilia sp. IC2-476]|uniref:PAS domain-containing protein n=1 Tax=Massilia sp. IC2-476 TaxID=2887199 RepID=UPI001D10FADB|nr:PAS domain-containing protein [Massilia sp. IC2-476]MCC2974371.1 PAS domain-containing protein [Massilia sp. IC2-476]
MTTETRSASGGQPGALNRQQLVAWQLAEVQAIGHVGTWEFHPPSEKLVWSDETCRIMGVGRSGFDGRIETFLSLVHPDDRVVVAAATRAARPNSCGCPGPISTP